MTIGTLLALPVGRRPAHAAPTLPAPAAVNQAADSRLSSTLNRLLVEHVYLVGLLVTTIHDDRQERLQASIDAVDTSSRELGDVVGQVHGPGVREAFLAPWRAHVGLYIDYAFGTATNDAAKKGAALASLHDARGNIDYALTSTNPRLRGGTVAELLRPQVEQIVAAIDALGAGDTVGAYASLRSAATGASAIADPLAEAFASRSPATAPTAPAPGSVPAAASPQAPASAPQGAPGCAVRGPASGLAPELDEFGWGGDSFVKQRDPTYWGGNGYLIGFERGDGDAFQSSPWGGYLIAGVIVAPDERAAAENLKGAVQGWTARWQPYDSRSLTSLGDQATVVARLTPWEIAPQQPMSEVFLAVRRCNVVAHFLLAVMPEHSPTTQAIRYAHLFLERIAA